jgi:chlorobactene glucosyltransferase
VAFAVVLVLVLCNLVYVTRTVMIVRDPVVSPSAGEMPAGAPLVTVVVPARNEERSIERCVRSLMAQTYSAMQIIVVDDASDDATAEIVARLAREDSRIELVRGTALPEGWVGKPWALVQGMRAARGSWLLFTDADTYHDPSSLGAALAFAQRERADALSLLTAQELGSFAERALLPTILWWIGFATGRLRDVNDPRKGNALFNGQYILVTRAAYDAIGGHESVRNEIAEDLELAHRFKEDGRFRSVLASAGGLVRARMYRSFGELWEGFVKNFALGTRGNVPQVVAGTLCVACVSPLTPVAFLGAMLAGHVLAALVLAACMAGALVVTVMAMERFGYPAASAPWFHPATAILVAIVATSLARHSRGGVTWRGRRYEPKLS